MVSMVYYIYTDEITGIFHGQFQDFFTTKYPTKNEKVNKFNLGFGPINLTTFFVLFLR